MTLSEVTREIRRKGFKSLVPFFTAGYPDPETCLRLVETADQAGCRVVEIGVPFSDPIADGPTIQEASKRALENGITLRRVLELTAKASQGGSAALVLMSYVNPILQMGYATFGREAHAAGARGVIIPDLPLEESSEVREVMRENDVTLIDLVAPTSSRDRISRIAAVAEGFLYLVSLTGVTGGRAARSSRVTEFVRRVRRQTDIPLYVGFGISTPGMASNAAAHADGVIVGSAIIRLVRDARSRHDAVRKTATFLRDMQRAVNDGRRSSVP